MSYNNSKYNTRNSGGRYNTGGKFVSAGELIPGTNPPRPEPARPPQAPSNDNSYGSSNQAPAASPAAPAPRAFHQNQNLQTVQLQPQDIEMKSEPKTETPSEEGGEAQNGSERPYWMKNKLAGVRKVSNKEKRRRQNETLRKLLTPKNALMVLNEMMPGEQLGSQFKVEASGSMYPQYNSMNQHNFCADLTLGGNTYKGYGENKLSARNAAAEQAIRDLIIKKMLKFINDGQSTGGEEGAAAGGAGAAASGAGAAGAGAAGAGGEEAEGEDEAETLPMIQLASFALHKLFSEWEYEGHKVPQLKPHPPAPAGETEGGAGADSAPAPKPPRPRAPRGPRTLPENAASMHPCMLLTHMRSQLEYRELGVDGDRPQNMMFTFGVEVDGATYLGKASNKKEARKAAARAACTALFGVQFEDPAVPMQG